MLFLGVDWAEDHHDLCVQADDGRVLARARISVGVEGVREVHELVAQHGADGEPVVVAIETSRGGFVRALQSAGYTVFALNPLAVSRYRTRVAVSGAKSDRADAQLLADIVRTDRHNHRPLTLDSEEAEALKVLARAHKNVVWSRQRAERQLRAALLEFYPAALRTFGEELSSRDAIAVLSKAPTPTLGRALSEQAIRHALVRAGRRRNVERLAARYHDALQERFPELPSVVVAAYRSQVTATLALLREHLAQQARLESELQQAFERHPDAEILSSLPGLGVVLGARVLSEFGDAPNRYRDPRARRNYSGVAPVTKASGRGRTVYARTARNDRLADALNRWAFCSLTKSPGAQAYYRSARTRGARHHHALRILAGRLVSILHVCLERRLPYDEALAWRHHAAVA